MTELKTLKDIFETNSFSYLTIKENDVIKKVLQNELRQEAIKWLKSNEVQGSYPDEPTYDAAGFIEEFFNLTEEDLK